MHPHDLKITPPGAIQDISILMTNGQVKSRKKRTGAQVNLSHNRLNADYYTYPYTNSHLFESKLDKGAAVDAK